MSVQLFMNDAASTLASSINDSDTSVTLAPGTGALFPSPGANEYFVGTFVDVATGLLNEIVWCTARSGDVLTIVRGEESTTPLSWGSGDLFNMFWTAGAAAAMLQQGQAQTQSGNYAIDTGSADALVITLSPAPSSLSALIGTPIRILVAAANATTTPTLNVNALGAHVIANWFGGTAGLPAGTLSVAKMIEVIWDGTQFQYNGQIIAASKTQIQGFTAGLTPITPAGFNSAYPGAVDAGLNGGHVYLPGGLLYQWGNHNSLDTSPITITFAVAFASTPRVTLGQTQSAGALPATPAVLSMSSLLTTAFTVYSCLWNGSTFINNTGTSFHWHAIAPGLAP